MKPTSARSMRGRPVTFTVDAYRGRTFAGIVSQIRLNASLQQNVVTYGVIVNVDNHDGKLLPYMTAKLQFEVARHKNAVLAPNQALRWQPTLSQVSPSALERALAWCGPHCPEYRLGRRRQRRFRTKSGSRIADDLGRHG